MKPAKDEERVEETCHDDIKKEKEEEEHEIDSVTKETDAQSISFIKETDAQSVVEDEDKASFDKLCNKVKTLTGQCQESLTALDSVYNEVSGPATPGTLLYFDNVQ